MNIGCKIQEQRRAKELTLRKVADLSGVSVSHLGRIERGERQASIYILRKIVKALDLNEIEFLKASGMLALDATDDRLERFKREIKCRIAEFETWMDAF